MPGTSYATSYSVDAWRGASPSASRKIVSRSGGISQRGHANSNVCNSGGNAANNASVIVAPDYRHYAVRTCTHGLDDKIQFPFAGRIGHKLSNGGPLRSSI